jgi:hypothetical protein
VPQGGVCADAFLRVQRQHLLQQVCQLGNLEGGGGGGGCNGGWGGKRILPG